MNLAVQALFMGTTALDHILDRQPLGAEGAKPLDRPRARLVQKVLALPRHLGVQPGQVRDGVAQADRYGKSLFPATPFLSHADLSRDLLPEAFSV